MTPTPAISPSTALQQGNMDISVLLADSTSSLSSPTETSTSDCNPRSVTVTCGSAPLRKIVDIVCVATSSTAVARFLAHKVILATHSTFFATMFEDCKGTNASAEEELEEVNVSASPAVFAAFLRTCYGLSSVLAESLDDVFDLLALAEQMHAPRVEEDGKTQLCILFADEAKRAASTEIGCRYGTSTIVHYFKYVARSHRAHLAGEVTHLHAQLTILRQLWTLWYSRCGLFEEASEIEEVVNLQQAKALDATDVIFFKAYIDDFRNERHLAHEKGDDILNFHTTWLRLQPPAKK